MTRYTLILGVITVNPCLLPQLRRVLFMNPNVRLLGVHYVTEQDLRGIILLPFGLSSQCRYASNEEILVMPSTPRHHDELISDKEYINLVVIARTIL